MIEGRSVSPPSDLRMGFELVCEMERDNFKLGMSALSSLGVLSYRRIFLLIVLLYTKDFFPILLSKELEV